MIENVLQQACMAALQNYIEHTNNKRYRQFFPSPRQQGKEVNLFCGDLIGIIDNSTLILFEFKELNHSSLTLGDFKDEQHAQLLEMEHRNLPVKYCYDLEPELAYDEDPAPDDWPAKTLAQFNVSTPALLPNKRPNIPQHRTLKQYIDGLMSDPSGDQISTLAKIVGSLKPSKIRNGHLLFLYSQDSDQLLALNADGIRVFYDWLYSKPGQSHDAYINKIRKLKKEIALENVRQNLKGPAKRKHVTQEPREPDGP